jgi:hypothetical protein
MDKDIYQNIIEFLKRPDIRDYLKDRNFDSIYHKVDDFVNFDKDDLTKVFKDKIGIDPFRYIKKITSSVLPNNIKIFECQNKDVETIYLTELPQILILDFAACKKVDQLTIRACPKLEEIGFPNFLTSLPERSLASLPSLGPVVVLPETVEFLGDECFCDDTSLQEIVIQSKKMPIIMGEPFKGCTKLTKIQFPNLTSDEVLPKLMNHLTEDNISNIGFRFKDSPTYEQTSEIEMMTKMFGLDPDEVVKELMNDEYVPEEDED